MMDADGWALLVAAVAAVAAVLSWTTNWGVSNKANNTAEDAKDEAQRANQIAQEALDETRKTRVDDAWDGYVGSLTILLSVDFSQDSERFEQGMAGVMSSYQKLLSRISGLEKRLVQADWDVFSAKGLQTTRSLSALGENNHMMRMQANEVMHSAITTMLNHIHHLRDGTLDEVKLAELSSSAERYLASLGGEKSAE